MWYIHRIFGEIRALKRTLLADLIASDRNRVSVLDVAAGSGELLQLVAGYVRTPSVFPVGAEGSQDAARSILTKGNAAVRCDALALPFAPNSFDYVFCTLFLHHLSESDAVKALSEMASIAKTKVVVIDLDRRILPYFAYRVLGRVFLQRFTRDDGALSILRSYRPKELTRIATLAGLRNFEIERSAVNRLVLTARV